MKSLLLFLAAVLALGMAFAGPGGPPGPDEAGPCDRPGCSCRGLD